MIETIFAPTGDLAPINMLAVRSAAGALLALLAATVAWRAGALGRSGAAAAVVCGALCCMAGWSWAAVLLLYFIAAALLSRAGAGYKAQRTESVVSKGGARDAAQVFANGGVYSIAAALTVAFSTPLPAWGAIGAIAAASSDTWATEIGVALGGEPRSILTRTVARQGESGGVTWAGTMGSIGGAAWIAVVALLAGLPRGLGLAALVGGVGGSLIDSLLGATVQERRWCDECGEPTERAVHLCGAATRRVGGIARLDNDVVNLLSTCAGFLLGVIIYCICTRSGIGGSTG